MELSLERPGDYLFVRWVHEDAIGVSDRTLNSSFVMGRDRLVEDWPVTDVDQLTPELMAPVLDLDPEVVLVGTGHRQRFVPTKVLAACLRRGIGLEAMDNAAAARTHSVLAAEQRRVVVAFILPQG